MKLTQKPP
ncbi:Protein of unknown function [Pyronema omphalodes CBS 100304]|uniref:Uncharacterized protein n=1 Tax=Pyronema omphalodes (strain CBS 100304) TaxID=1076935 RepID=U4LMX8_PYROM|nr:Protein of unknown function [Pyronema omphalodes CBS 100304]